VSVRETVAAMECERAWKSEGTVHIIARHHNDDTLHCFVCHQLTVYLLSAIATKRVLLTRSSAIAEGPHITVELSAVGQMHRFEKYSPLQSIVTLKPGLEVIQVYWT